MSLKSKLTEQDYLELCNMLHDSKTPFTQRNSLSSTVKMLGFHSAVSTILIREGLCRTFNVDGNIRKTSYEWVGIKPNIHTARKLKDSLTQYWRKHEKKDTQSIQKTGVGQSVEKNANWERVRLSSEAKIALFESSKINIGLTTEMNKRKEQQEIKPSMRPIRKLVLSKDFKAGFALANILSKLDVVPTLEELQEVIDMAEKMKKETF